MKVDRDNSNPEIAVLVGCAPPLTKEEAMSGVTNEPSQRRKLGAAMAMALGLAAVALCAALANAVAKAEEDSSEFRKLSDDALDCHTAVEGEACFDAITWAMQEGIHSNPEWYEPLRAASSFEDFQELFHEGGHESKCLRPCAVREKWSEELQNPQGLSQFWTEEFQNETLPDPNIEIDRPRPFIRRRRQWRDMMSCRRRHSWEGSLDLPEGWVCDGSSVRPEEGNQQLMSFATVETEPYINHYQGNNPLHVEVDPVRSNNYFLIIGDWGKADGPGPCQRTVAEKMRSYVEAQKSAGKRLMVIGSVGDNFYWSGADAGSWDRQFEPAYKTNEEGSPLAKVPWLVAMGNHDYGDNDPYGFCPDRAPDHIKRIHEGQAYAHSQLNRDRSSVRPQNYDHYWFPDLNFHYEIPEADVEFISLDTNFDNVVNHLGADAQGFRDAFAKCGGVEPVAQYLRRVQESGTALLRERAEKGNASTVVILQHYPWACQKDVFLQGLPEWRKSTKVLCAWGHDHSQECLGQSEGTCDTVLTGGGGGCCGNHKAGFTAVHLTDDGGFITDVESDAVSMPSHDCHWRRM